MSTYKTQIFEKLFEDRWDEETLRPNDPIVKLEHVQDAIGTFNENNPDSKISDRNPANFFKDFVRSIHLANKHWPTSIRNRGYTAIQVTGGGRAFKFVPIKTGADPFPKIERSSPRDTATLIESLSIPKIARDLGRRDDSWLMQVAVRLRLVETDFSRAHDDFDITHIELLQLGVKQSRAEINGLYIAEHEDGDYSIIPVEAKVRDDIYLAQILAQIDAVRSLPIPVDRLRDIIPLAIKAEGNSRLLVIRFAAVPFASDGGFDTHAESRSLYQLFPEVGGL